MASLVSTYTNGGIKHGCGPGPVRRQDLQFPLILPFFFLQKRRRAKGKERGNVEFITVGVFKYPP
jgi:hypothetical protein